MTTTSQDFRVKNGLRVTGGAEFGAPVIIPAPTHSAHAVSRGYVEENIAPVVSSTAPTTPSNGRLWFDTSLQRLKVYYGSAWVTLATTQEALAVPDHIHDTTIDGDGRIETVFYDSSQYDDPQIITIEGGSPSSVTWDTILDGGSA
jgi:hypothetical protein